MITIKKEHAIIFNDDGTQNKIINFSKKDKSFNYLDGEYLIIRKENNYTKFVSTRLFILRREDVYYEYTLGNPTPREKTDNIQPKFHAEYFDVMLKTKILKDLNRIDKSFLQNLNWRTILIIGVVLVAVYYVIKNGGLI